MGIGFSMPFLTPLELFLRYILYIHLKLEAYFCTGNYKYQSDERHLDQPME